MGDLRGGIEDDGGGGEEGGRGRVTVVAKSTAVGVKPVRAGKTHPLSAPDHAMGRHTLHLVYYYRPSPALDRERLLESLSEVLSYYPAMTGRLTWQHHDPQEETAGAGAWVVKCNDAGVRMVDARADATLEEWLRTASDEEEMELAYWEPMGPEPYVWSPYYIQITEFKDKGYGVGVSCTHMHGDPTCVAVFLKAWSDAHRRATIPDYPPPPLLSLKSANANADTNSPPPSSAFSSATFRFSSASLRRLLSDLSPQTETPSPSPFAALASLFWLRIASASSSSSPAKAAAEGEAALTLGVDFRKRMSAPLPMGTTATRCSSPAPAPTCPAAGPTRPPSWTATWPSSTRAATCGPTPSGSARAPATRPSRCTGPSSRASRSTTCPPTPPSSRPGWAPPTPRSGSAGPRARA
uniref:Protein ECERIFERUM 26-like n=1 Tax=Ananas comosus var. bracteatus TaxID=296719 RepID=A0A6V7QXF9_ANACO